jgi:hypothetical protein
MSCVVMPFGKYRSQPLKALDDPYLLWLLCLEDLREPLLTAINSEADKRMGKLNSNAAELDNAGDKQ